jgi:hypothetical protein
VDRLEKTGVKMGRATFELTSADGGCDFHAETERQTMDVAVGSDWVTIDICGDADTVVITVNGVKMRLQPDFY